jgi:hypothetical protein
MADRTHRPSLAPRWTGRPRPRPARQRATGAEVRPARLEARQTRRVRRVGAWSRAGVCPSRGISRNRDSPAWTRSGRVFAEEELAVVAAEEEGEAVQVGAERVPGLRSSTRVGRGLNPLAQHVPAASRSRAMVASWPMTPSSSSASQDSRMATCAPAKPRAMTGTGYAAAGSGR